MKTLIFADTGKDLDDEESIILGSFLHKKGIIDIMGYVITLEPIEKRVNLTKGLIETLELDIPVYQGNKVSYELNKVNDYEFNTPYYKYYSLNLNINDLINSIKKEKNNSIKIIIQAGFSDFYYLLREYSDLMINKIHSVYIMGGILFKNDTPLLKEGKYIPDSSHNNYFDKEASDFCYEFLQNNNIKTFITNRDVIYQNKQNLDILKTSHNIIKDSLYNRKKESLKSLWTGIINKDNYLPKNRTIEWYIKTFCENFEYKNETDFEIIWKHIHYCFLYDPINLLTSIDNFKSNFNYQILNNNFVLIKNNNKTKKFIKFIIKESFNKQ